VVTYGHSASSSARPAHGLRGQAQVADGTDHFIQVWWQVLDFPLPLSTVAELDGQLVEPWVIATSVNDSLKILFDDPNAVSP
jgi:hypothetical protein